MAMTAVYSVFPFPTTMVGLVETTPATACSFDALLRRYVSVLFISTTNTSPGSTISSEAISTRSAKSPGFEEVPKTALTA